MFCQQRSQQQHVQHTLHHASALYDSRLTEPYQTNQRVVAFGYSSSYYLVL